MDYLNVNPLIYEGIYLLQEERFIETNKNIYKIGRSKNIYNRVSNYENGSIVYLIVGCANSESIETELIKIFNNDFKLAKYYGNEYFIGDLEEMKDTIIEYIKTMETDTIKLIDMEIKIDKVDKITELPIPKYKQEIYSKAKLTTLNFINNVWTEYIEDDNETTDNVENEFEDYIEEIKQPQPIIDNKNIVNNYTINNNNGGGNIVINAPINAPTPVNTSKNKICPCGKAFDRPSLLKRHQNGKLGCIPYLISLKSPPVEHIEEDDEESTKVVKEFFCKFCNRKLATKFSMERHYNTCSKNEDNKIKPNIANRDVATNNLINNNNFRDLLLDIINTGNISNINLNVKTGDMTLTRINDN